MDSPIDVDFNTTPILPAPASPGEGKNPLIRARSASVSVTAPSTPLARTPASSVANRERTFTEELSSFPATPKSGRLRSAGVPLPPADHFL